MRTKVSRTWEVLAFQRSGDNSARGVKGVRGEYFFPPPLTTPLIGWNLPLVSGSSSAGLPRPAIPRERPDRCRSRGQDDGPLPPVPPPRGPVRAAGQSQRHRAQSRAGTSMAARGPYRPALALDRTRTHRPRSLSTTSRPWSSSVPRYSTVSLAIRPHVSRIAGPSTRQVKDCGAVAAKSSPSAKPLACTTSDARPSSQLPTKPLGPAVLQPPSIPPIPRNETQTAIGRKRDTRSRLEVGEGKPLHLSRLSPPEQVVLLATPQALPPPAPTNQAGCCEKPTTARVGSGPEGTCRGGG